MGFKWEYHGFNHEIWWYGRIYPGWLVSIGTYTYLHYLMYWGLCLTHGRTSNNNQLVFIISWHGKTGSNKWLAWVIWIPNMRRMTVSHRVFTMIRYVGIVVDVYIDFILDLIYTIYYIIYIYIIYTLYLYINIYCIYPVTLLVMYI